MKAFWNERYGASEYAYGKAPNVWLKQWLDARPATGRILFPAEGEGRNAVYAAKLGWEVYAFDQSDSGREKALRLAEADGVGIDYQVCDVLEYAPEGAFDVIALIYAHFPPDIRGEVHGRLAAMLKPGGRLVLEGYHKRQLGRKSGGPPVEAMLYSEAELEGDFAALETEILETCLTDLDEGLYHRGEAEVIRYVGRKPTSGEQ